MSDIQEAYTKGRMDGEKSVLRMIQMVLDNADQAGWGISAYYNSSLNLILELYDYGKEKKDTKQEKAASAASKS